MNTVCEAVRTDLGSIEVLAGGEVRVRVRRWIHLRRLLPGLKCLAVWTLAPLLWAAVILGIVYACGGFQ